MAFLPLREYRVGLLLGVSVLSPFRQSTYK